MRKEKIMALTLGAAMMSGMCPQYHALAYSKVDTPIISAVISNDMVTFSGTTPEQNESVSIILTEKATTRNNISSIEDDNDLMSFLKNFYITESIDYSFTKELSCDVAENEFKAVITSENMMFEQNISKNKENKFAIEDYSADEKGRLTVKGSTTANGKIYILDSSVFEEDLTNSLSDENIAKYTRQNSSVAKGDYELTFNETFIDDSSVGIYIETDKEKAVYKATTNYVHVSTNGSDTVGDGTISNPFATIEGAKKYLRENKTSKEMLVIIHGGKYTFTEPVLFEREDSGEVDRNITYKAAENEKVIFSGAQVIEASDFSKADEKIKARLRGGAKENALMLDLKKVGISGDFLTMQNTNGNFRYLNIFLNDNRQEISAWPNVGKFKITDAVAGEEKERFLTISDLDTSKWQYSDNIYIYGCTGSWWNHEWNKIAAFPEKTDTIMINTFSTDPVMFRGEDYNNPQFTGRILNVLEEMDIPGEWCLDVDNELLYYYPPYELTSEDCFEIAVLDDDIIDVVGCNNINFEGISFEKNASKAGKRNQTIINSGHGLHIEKSQNINIKNCSFKAIGASGINADGKNIVIDGCKVSDMGRSGICVQQEGCRDKITPTGIVVKNNIVSDVAREQSGNGGVGIYLGNDNVETLVKNNVVHNTRNIAIRYGGLGNVISYNEIYNAMNDSSDSGAIYAGRSWADYGNVIEYNYIHDYGSKNEDESPAWHAAGIYWDDKHIGNTARFNIIVPNNKYDGYMAYINGGGQNTLEKNIFVNGKVGVDYRASGISNLDIGTCEDRVLEIPYNSEIYLERYPKINKTYTTWKNNNKFYSYNYLKNNFNVGAGNNFAGPDEIKLWNSFYNTSDTVIDYTEEVFIKENKHDYRITDNAKSKYKLRDDIPGSQFDMESIGLEVKYLPTDEDKAFDLLYPQNNGVEINPESVELVWEKSEFADEYEYFVYSDKEGNNVIKNGTTRYTNASVSGLEYGKTYYWQVVAKNASKDFGFSHKSSIYSFSTERALLITEVKREKNMISFKAENKNTAATAFTVIAAVRDNDGKLLAVECRELDINQKGIFEKSVKLENEIPVNAEKIEFYVWQDLKSLKPITEKMILN